MACGSPVPGASRERNKTPNCGQILYIPKPHNSPVTMAKRKSQGALEYLITYGWAILIIVIIGGALFALGIFNPSSWVSNKRATGFTTIQMRDWVFQGTSAGGTANILIAVIQNKAGAPINLWRINTTDGWGTCDASFSNVLIQEEDSIQFPTSCLTGNIPSGKSYSLSLQILYSANGLNHTDFGTITGKAE
jgi:hypothetical protein